MACIGNGNEQQNVSRVKRRTTLFPLNTHGVAQPQTQALQPQLQSQPPQTQPQSQPADQELEAVVKHLLVAKDAIEASRVKVLDRQTSLSYLTKAFQQEQKLRADCSDAYAQLHSRYRQLLTEKQDMSTNCHSLNQQVEEAQGTISSLESKIRELENTAKDELANAEWQISSRDREREEMMQQHQDQLVNATNYIGALQGKIDQLEKERWQTTQKHQSTMDDAADSVTAGEQKIGELKQKIHELEKKCSILEAHELSDSTEHSPSPKTKRSRRAEAEPETSSQEQSGPATRSRKRRPLATVKGADTIVVSV